MILKTFEKPSEKPLKNLTTKPSIMKKQLIISLFSLALPLFLMAQDQTLFDDVDRTGAWGGPLFEYSSLDGDVQVASGGGGALILDDFYLGGYGMGDVEFDILRPTEDIRERVKFKHGGLWLGYTPMQSKVLHPYASVKFGWGKARYRSSQLDDPEIIFTELNDNIFVMTPELGFEVNVFSWFRMAMTGSYRMVSGLGAVPNFDEQDLSEFALQLTLRFGGFGSDNDWD
jgi:hypothetical protein